MQQKDKKRMARGTAVLAFLAVCAAVWLFLVQFTQEIDSIRYIEWETAWNSW